MQINWKVRAKNVYFWIALIGAIAAPMFAGVGVQWDDIKSWNALLDAAFKAISNPNVVLAMLIAAWGVIIDPTTRGASDSSTAMTYTEPKVEGKHVKEQ